MKNIRAFLVLASLFFIASFGNVLGQTYPYWDAADPGGLFSGDSGDYGGPVIATSNAVFTIRFQEDVAGPAGPAVVDRWTECGGWEDLSGLTFYNYSYGSVHSTPMMTFHDHYLYVVGFFSILGYTNSVSNSDLNPDSDCSNYVQIARFDLNTGAWQALGQNFQATDVIWPTTVAVDVSNRIYVGFRINVTGEGSQTVDMLDVSTNEGASWQELGGGLVTSTYTFGLAEISAMDADGTNVYIGGDFDGPAGGISSPHVTMWTGNGWRGLTGVVPDSGQYIDCGDENGLDTVNAIFALGTNVYVAGSFESPTQGFARFSNVTGDSLPTGDPASFLGWSLDENKGGTSLAINDGVLYFGAYLDGDGNECFAALAEPQDPSPDQWSNLTTDGANTIDVQEVEYIAAATNGSAIYVGGQIAGEDSSGNSSLGFSRLIVSPDVDSQWAILTNGAWSGSTFTFTAVGTPGSHWVFLSSSDDINWSDAHLPITLWSGSNSFSIGDCSALTYFMISNNCGGSPVYASEDILNVQFGEPGDQQQLGFAATGIYTNDGWNLVPGATNWDGDGPVYLDGMGVFDGYAVTDASLFDCESNYTGASILVLSGEQYSTDPPVDSYDDTYSRPILNSVLTDGGGEAFGLNLNLPYGHTYDVYFYGATFATKFTLTGYSGYYEDEVSLSDWSPETTSPSDPGGTFEEGNQYVVFTGLVGGSWTVQVSSGVQPVVNGMQIVVH